MDLSWVWLATGSTSLAGTGVTLAAATRRRRRTRDRVNLLLLGAPADPGNGLPPVPGLHDRLGALTDTVAGMRADVASVTAELAASRRQLASHLHDHDLTVRRLDERREEQHNDNAVFLTRLEGAIARVERGLLERPAAR